MIEEPTKQFEGRKVDHIKYALSQECEALGGSALDRVQLIHEALPDGDFSEVDISSSVLKTKVKTPFLVSSMTAGHASSLQLNQRLAIACEERGWMMGVGSQRRELFDAAAAEEWRRVRLMAPKVMLLGNLGITQVIKTSTDQIRSVLEPLQPSALIVHLNSLQECLQPEGTPYFRGGLERIASLVKELSLPIIVKETGCGFSQSTLRRLSETGIAAVDVSGYGGTHWGRIEGQRSAQGSILHEAAKTFADWGVSTVESVIEAMKFREHFEVWASGGIRSGIDATKMIAMGSNCVGLAKPILAAALEGEEALRQKMELLETEFKIALFCTGAMSIKELNSKKVWKWRA